MDKFQAMHDFFSSFGLKAYEENSVPDGKDSPAFPYLTYEASSSYGDSEIQINFSIWYRDDGMKAIDLKVQEIAESIGHSKIIDCDEGSIVIRPGDSFSQSMGDEGDRLVKRKLFTLYAKFITIF